MTAPNGVGIGSLDNTYRSTDQMKEAVLLPSSPTSSRSRVWMTWNPTIHNQKDDSSFKVTQKLELGSVIVSQGDHNELLEQSASLETQNLPQVSPTTTKVELLKRTLSEDETADINEHQEERKGETENSPLLKHAAVQAESCRDSLRTSKLPYQRGTRPLAPNSSLSKGAVKSLLAVRAVQSNGTQNRNSRFTRLRRKWVREFMNKR
ncbi:unnamed protein product [Protopolystoma xenopodis]|uniref:Uncharacterized protein n=1 Tax=Protopolystoma xenopodis TaxID=117903 RepID=A0A3S5ADC9_9PLAT|nr:unnamed protein product [Protopolystoma xenopodis]